MKEFNKLQDLSYKHFEYIVRYVPVFLHPLLKVLQYIYYYLQILPKTKAQKDCLHIIINSWYTDLDREVGAFLFKVYREYNTI